MREPSLYERWVGRWWLPSWALRPLCAYLALDLGGFVVTAVVILKIGRLNVKWKRGA